MIALTRLNGGRFVLNAELIRTLEEKPDTVVTLVGGEHLMVRERMEEVIELVIRYRQCLRRLAPPGEAVG